ncbi:tetratricopeptide repeat-containing hybrid sensor histidine kinase/response regulator [Aquimarina longa]|uniref:tetratricopeptide repeat-containing hybrid sensor histidine kinase/response regulator n=1 Tax=Aquimarina longa TaxID=1080221 RepID=UPI000785F4CE|nr:response regulator [Aquimarina longa]
MKRKSLILIITLYSFSCIIAQENNKTLKDSIYKLLSFVSPLNSERRFKESIAYANSAIKLSRSSGNIKLIIQSQRKLAEIYIRMGEPEKGITIIKELITEVKKTEHKKELADLYCLLGLSYRKLNDINTTEQYLLISLKTAKEIEYAEGQRVALINLGILNFRKEKYNVAHKYFETAIPFFNSEDEKSVSLPYYFALTKIELEDYNNAELYLAKALKISEGNIINLRGICLAYAKLYEKQNQLKKAITWYKKYDKYIDTYINDFNQLKDETLKLKYDLKIKDNQIQIASKEKEIREAEIKTSNMIIYFTTFLLAGFLFTILIMYQSKRKEKKLNSSLKEKNKELLIAKEKVESLSNIKSNFFSMISHELRTPLYTITGITELLIQNNPEESQKSFLESLKFAGTHLISLINNILQNNSIEKKELKMHLQSFTPKELIHNIVNTFEYHANKSNNTLHLNYDDTIPSFLYGDVMKLSQILNNLLSNAMKFTHNGNIWITIKKDLNKQNNYLFSIKDDGIGIDINKQKMIFNDFLEESMNFDKKYEGSGLGLQISKKLLNLLGSEIEFNSKTNNGSEFFFTIEFKEVSIPEENNKKISNDSDTIFDNKKIVVIDDNKVNLVLTKKILENKKMNVTVFENPIKAIEDIKNKPYELVLMDIHMPPINGYEATQIIRKFDKDIPIIALTASSLQDNKEKAIKAGMNDFINKPYIQKEFFEIISQHIRS